MDDQVMILEDGSRINLVHFTCKDAGRWIIACSPSLLSQSAIDGRAMPWRRSDDARAVTCPLCKQTPEWKRLASLNPPRK